MYMLTADMLFTQINSFFMSPITCSHEPAASTLPFLLVSNIHIIIKDRRRQCRPQCTLHHLCIDRRQLRPRSRERGSGKGLPNHACRIIQELHYDCRAIHSMRASDLNGAAGGHCHERLCIGDAGVRDLLLVEVRDRGVHGIPLRLAFFFHRHEPCDDADGTRRILEGCLSGGALGIGPALSWCQIVQRKTLVCWDEVT